MYKIFQNSSHCVAERMIIDLVVEILHTHFGSKAKQTNAFLNNQIT